MAELHRLLLRQQSQLSILQARFDKLTDSFCLYWVSETHSALGIVCQKFKDKKGNVASADILVLSHTLSVPDLKRDKKPITRPDEPKLGKWEPLILPQDVFAQVDLLSEDKDEDGSGNSALT